MLDTDTLEEMQGNRSLSLTYSQQELLDNLNPSKVLEVLDFAKQMENTAKVLAEQMSRINS
jgi:hypothetical protein